MIARDIAVAGAFRSLMSAPASDLRAAARTRRQSYERPGPPLPVPGLFLASDVVSEAIQTWKENSEMVRTPAIREWEMVAKA